jgi:hypothetical protein
MTSSMWIRSRTCMPTPPVADVAERPAGLVREETELERGRRYRFAAEGAAGLQLRRLATTLPPEALPWPLTAEPVMLALPRDASSEPWRGVISGSPVRVGALSF